MITDGAVVPGGCQRRTLVLYMDAGSSGGTGNVEWVVESIALYGVDLSLVSCSGLRRMTRVATVQGEREREIGKGSQSTASG